MNLILNIPLPIRYVILAIVGAWIGGQINRAIYRWAYHQRSISPWSAPPKEAAPRSWIDRLPIIGWFGMRRESPLHGSGFWIRPLLLEAVCTAALPALYYWEISGQILPPLMGATTLAGPVMLHGQFLSHAVLIGLMIIATFIDFDEQCIPDWVTVPGTLFALLLASLWPSANLPVTELKAGVPSIGPLTVTSPLPWPIWFDGPKGLALACGGYLLWLVALLGYVWYPRRGLRKAFEFMFASLLRDKVQWIRTAIMAVIGIALIVGTYIVGGEHWISLFSAIVGLVAGGLVVWLVRIMASYALGREAMGFGDVTLLAMIGAFLGWQPAFMIFFLAPVCGCLIAVIQALATGRTEIAFGPYLCAAALVMILWWDAIWRGWAVGVFQLGWFIPLVVFVCIVLMGAMLVVWQFIKLRLLSFGDEE